MFDLTYEEQAFLASTYFHERIEKVSLFNGSDIINFGPYCDNAGGGNCFAYSTYAILCLQPDDLRLCGTIDTFPRKGYKDSRNYEHAWVEFMKDERWYVYDPMQKIIFPRELWYKFCNPRDIYSKLTQREIFKKFLTPKFAHVVEKNRTYVFKSLHSDKPGGYKEEDNNEENGFLFNVLSGGIIKGFLYKGCFYMDSFLARR